MKSLRLLIIAALASGLAKTVSNAQTTFEFGNNTNAAGSFFAGKITDSLTQDSIALTMTSLTGDAFNATADGFGVNQTAGGDDTDGFDFTETAGDGVAENFTISFYQDVTLISFGVSSFGVADEITIFDDGITVATISGTGASSLGNYLLDSSSTLSITTTAGTYGNGWEFESITVSAVPEPGAYALLASLCGMACVALRRRP